MNVRLHDHSSSSPPLTVRIADTQWLSLQDLQSKETEHGICQGRSECRFCVFLLIMFSEEMKTWE